MTAEDALRSQVRDALDAAGISQAGAARILGVSTKHLCQMLTGRAPLTLAWAEDIVALCDKRIEVFVLDGPRRDSPETITDLQLPEEGP
ncbi:hypothetical protein ACIOUE_00850 [Streptomyces xanthochromogenes]|uniref:hypothetical protein n=1 Tax=Streptomyces xanthochromogenes TaxID=67384 RepID=UPI0037F9059D